jgi:5'-nucleotidase
MDEGVPEMLRLVHGGNHAQGPYLQDPYQGAQFPYICANLVQAISGKPVFPPYVIREVAGVQVGFIGALLHRASAFLSPESLGELKVLDEADTINLYVRQLQARGVRTIIAVIHQGGFQQSGEIAPQSDPLVGDIVPVVKRLDSEVDVVLAGHTHTFHNTLAENNQGKKILVAQAWPKGTGYADIDLEISRTSGDVVAMSSRIVTTWADAGPGLTPDTRVAALMHRVETMGNALAGQAIAKAARPITRAVNEAGESALGDLVADAHRQAMGTDFAFINADGIRADIAPGGITKGDHYTVQPFQLNLIKLELTGQQIYDLLNQQWTGREGADQLLQVSGLTYTWDADKPTGERIVAVRQHGEPLQPGAVYTVTVNEYLAGGGDNFTVLTQGTHPVVGPFVADALIRYVQAQPQPLNPGIADRIYRLN